jgi:hypothetical protein
MEVFGLLLFVGFDLFAQLLGLVSHPCDLGRAEPFKQAVMFAL